MKKILYILSASTLLLFGCDKSQEPPRSMTVDKTALLFDREGNATDGREVKVSSTVDWVAKSDKAWCAISPSSVRGNGVITIVVEQNAGFADRVANIAVVSSAGDLSETIVVTQSQNEYTLGVTPTELRFDMSGNPLASGNTLGINTNDRWQITYDEEADAEWLALSRPEGKGNFEVTLTAEMNYEVDDRVANLTVTVGDKTVPVTVTQEKASDQAAILTFSLPGASLTGAIDEPGKTIKLKTAERLVGQSASVTISPFATISPDPTAARSYEEPVEFTVTAFNGVTKTTYTVSKELPAKVAKGVNPASGKLLWVKHLKNDVGIATKDLTGGMAVTADNVVLNTRAEASVVLDRYTGARVGTIALGAEYTASVKNFYSTADEAGNVLVSNLTANDGNTFRISKVAGLTGPAQPFIAWDGGGLPLGRKFSVKGSVDGDAVIVAPVLNNSMRFARWQVTGGALVSQTPEVVTVSVADPFKLPGWTTWVDVVPSSATDPAADYFIIARSTFSALWPADGGTYTVNAGLTWVDGATNAVKAQQGYVSSNYYPNAVDHVLFNGNPYVAYNYVNPYAATETWAAGDQIAVIDTGNQAAFATPDNLWGLPAATNPCVVWISPEKIHGVGASGMLNGNQTGDVAFRVSANGYYLDIYFMFTNGNIVCYRYDCIQ